MKRILFAAIIASLAASCGPKDIYTITNGNGMRVDVTPYGGRVVSMVVPDRNGEMKDVVLGFDDIEDYHLERHQTDFGASIGRYANRICRGQFSLDGNDFQIGINNGVNALHGGPTGWQYQTYKVVEADASHIKLEMDSPDGDNGFPGNVTAFVTYTLTDDNALDIAYEATTDAPTVINMTNHSYFNLSGDPANHSICDDYLYINSASFTPTDEGLIPTGEIVSVEGTPMDFRNETRIGDRIDDTSFQPIAFAGGYDHNWILSCDDETIPAATLYCPESGIELTVYTNEPGIQVYSGNFLDGTVIGKGGIAYQKRTAICLETQHFPDSPNHNDWPSTVLRPGETYRSHCVYSLHTRE